MKITFKKAPTTHTAHWTCEFCGAENHTRIEGGEPFPALIQCVCCGLFKYAGHVWRYDITTEVDDITDVAIAGRCLD